MTETGSQDVVIKVPVTLAQKLAHVMGVVDRIPKRGRNEFHKYDYAAEADIVDAVRGELATVGVAFVPQVDSLTREACGEKGAYLTTIALTIRLIDGESGETLTVRWLGCGVDNQDKGLYKALTGAVKYFLLKTFLIPTGDDPEASDERGKPTDLPALPAKGVIRTERDLKATEAHEAFERGADTGEVTDPAAPTGRISVVKVEEARRGTGKKGPWVKYAITFDDGRTASTFSHTLAHSAKGCMESHTPVDVVLDRSTYGLELVELKPVVDPDDVPF
jgi:hypothetical protein